MENTCPYIEINIKPNTVCSWLNVPPWTKDKNTVLIMVASSQLRLQSTIFEK